MTREQRELIFDEWKLYQYRKKKKIISDYLRLCNGYYSQEGFLNYLRDRLELEGYWRKVKLG